ncbi:calcium-translocating P-type ATPase, SERCA-type [Sulfoacidibacillus thermotolerans]|uniref:Calcium-translocating P-type ATPase, SERCA-type n=1 Tax=Sulfoacidibacillus thermotolerans TaxID=1765684 RepID=A0A2U3D7V3_SULT2|nr:calcium-translocating P-type ATPase, SERCA-type [Sulfoacidibacillus thermotolerans]PWI57364.1 calcium-translocating P-type ATPase, SERCA-type [Sulfoacidibacillus thermotolerans]
MHAELWHTKSIDEVFITLDGRREGLTEAEAQERRLVYGDNQLQERARVSLISTFFDQFRNFMVIVLLIATLISGLLGEFTDAITIIVIIVANAILGFFQQVRAERSLASLKELTAPTAKVLRSQEWREVLARELVPGDIIGIEAGDRIPADARLLSAEELETVESSLTGESLPVSKQVTPVNDPEAPLGDRFNMLYMGTVATRGVGQAIIVETGMSTEMGKIADLIQSSEEGMTPLEQRLNQLGHVLVYVSLAITVIVVIAGVFHGHELYEMFLAGVSLAVAAIPEGLPAIVTIALALGVQRMIKRNAIVRKLPSVETLGCATVICSDKTGTLTQNEMTVKEIYVDGQTIEVEGDGYEAKGQLLLRGKPLAILPPNLKKLIDIGLTCNHAHLVTESDKQIVLGDPTEAALLVLAQKAQQTTPAERVKEFPFDSTRKRMTVLIKNKDGGYTAFVKGAPDLLLSQCAFIQSGIEVSRLNEQKRQEVLQALTHMAGRAMRTLGFAYRNFQALPLSVEAAERDLIFIGVVGMIDPPRQSVPEAIQTCKRAGIRTVMVTGDHQLTAEAIARNLGLLPRHGLVMTGTELDRLSDRALEDKVDDVYVFARVSPLHKLRIVKALQKNGHVVAMTGDGVNDAPAIKASDIGIAMGKSGTDVAKDASALILADDHFATIAAAIEEGRAIYDNIRKFIRYLLTSNVGEMITMFLAMVGGLPLPLLPIQILWVNLVTDGLPAIALGLDAPEAGSMERPPRSVREGIFARGLGRKIIVRGFLIGVMTLLVFYGALSLYHTSLQTAQTMAFATLVIAQLIHVFACHSGDDSKFYLHLFENWWLVGAVASSLVLLLIVIYVPSLQSIFHTVQLPLGAWLAIVVAALVPSLALSLRKKTFSSRSLAPRVR